MKPNRNHAGVILIFAGSLVFFLLASLALTTADISQSAKTMYFLGGLIIGGSAVGVGVSLIYGSNRLISYSLAFGGLVSTYVAVNSGSTLEPELGLVQLSFLFLAAVAFINMYYFYCSGKPRSIEQAALYGSIGVVGVAILVWLSITPDIRSSDVISVLLMFGVLFSMIWSYW